MLRHCIRCQNKKGANKISISRRTQCEKQILRREALLQVYAFRYQPQKERSGEEKRKGKAGGSPNDVVRLMTTFHKKDITTRNGSVESPAYVLLNTC